MNTSTASERAVAARDTAIMRALRKAGSRTKAPTAAETTEELRAAGLSGKALTAAQEAAERIRKVAASDESLFGTAGERHAREEAGRLVESLPTMGDLDNDRQAQRAADNETPPEGEAEDIVNRLLTSTYRGDNGAASRSRAATKGIKA